LDAPETVMLPVADVVTASDERAWKYLGIGLPLLSVKDWPMSEEPTSLPPFWTTDPLAWCPKASSPRPVRASP
jgi:hypothetical protein